MNKKPFASGFPPASNVPLAPSLDPDEEGEEESGREGPQCVDCGARSPSTNTNYTLISSKGWRLTLQPSGDGKRRGEWRCPTCWEKHKRGSSPP